MKNTTPKYECVICHNEEEGYGNNPNPIVEVGKCCDKCNIEVIRERMRRVIGKVSK